MMALDNNSLLFSQQPLLDNWDPYSFGLGLVNAHELFMPLDIDSPMSSEASTGYLQDAVAQWSDRCKRRRLATSPCDTMFMAEDIHELLQLQGFWDSTCYGDPLGTLNCLAKENSNFSGDNLQNCSSKLQEDLLSPPTSSQKEPMSENSDKKETNNSRGSIMILKDDHKELEQEKEKRKKKMKKVVYPFAVLKPVGLEGDVTLDDINERILMRPTRPVKHPVGEFAFGPCVSAGGPGLSGKAVVGLTRIHTQGRGTITIIRTRG